MEEPQAALALDGSGLTPERLAAAAEPGAAIALTEAARRRIAEARAVIDDAIARRLPVYGVTTGLGSRVTEALGENALAAFSLQTRRGRAHATGAPLPAALVRAAMIARLNTICLGAAGVSPAVAEGLAAAINARLTPVVGETGSIGSSDLLLGATMGLALAGEGSISDSAGIVRPAADALAAAGLAPLPLGPRDGLALASHDAFSTTAAALALVRAERAWRTVQAAAALSAEGFRANLSPLRPEVLALRPLPGEREAGEALRALLSGSALAAPGAARRLQDPLSFRTVVQAHGALRAALDFARSVVVAELNGASDNPVVLVESGEIVSTGNFQTPHLLLACETVARGVSLTATLVAARIARLLSSRFTDLPQYLAAGPEGAAGLAPLTKVSEALLAAVQAEAALVPLWPGHSADGVEDALTHAFLAARRLDRLLDAFERLVAAELLTAARAVALRQPPPEIAPRLAQVRALVESRAVPLQDDRPLGGTLGTLAQAVRDGEVDRASGLEGPTGSTA